MKRTDTSVKTRIKRICAVACFSALVFLCIFGTYKVLKWKDTMGEYLSSVDMLKATDKELIDVVFMGSSHAYNGFNPAYFWEDEGWSCFDMAISGQDATSTYYYLKYLLRRQSPKVVCVDLYGFTFDKHGVQGNEYRNYLSMPAVDLQVKMVREYVDEEDRQDYIVRFPIVHTRYKELGKYDFYNYKLNDYIRGEKISWTVGEACAPESSDGSLSPAELSESKVKWLDDMYELSQKEGFSLVLVALPYNIPAESQDKIDTVSKYCEEKGIAFYDFNRLRHEIGFDYTHDFVDSGHLNIYGAKKVEMFLKEEFECYNLPDHRGDERYYQWDEDLEYFDREEYKNSMRVTDDLCALCSMICAGEDYVSVISLEGDYLDRNNVYYEPLWILGMSYEEYEKGGKWIFEDGTLTKVFENEINADPYIKELGDMNTLKVQYEGDYLFRENIMINDESVYSYGSFMTIAIYDKKLGELVSVKGF